MDFDGAKCERLQTSVALEPLARKSASRREKRTTTRGGLLRISRLGPHMANAMKATY
jgi:hypothetical protein